MMIAHTRKFYLVNSSTSENNHGLPYQIIQYI